MGFKIIPEVEKILIGLIKAGYWLQYAQKLYRDHWRYFHGVEDGFSSTPKMLRRVENWFWKLPQWLKS